MNYDINNTVLKQVLEFVVKNQRSCTVSEIQRVFEVSYVIAGKIIDDLSIILPESWTIGLVKKLLNLTKRYDRI